MLGKYLTIFNVSLTQYFVYRLNFILWRFRVVLNIVLTYFLWNSVYHNKSSIFSYTKDQMLTYILFIAVANSLILTGKTADIAGEILNGDIINYLLKPVSFFSYITTREAADKLLNFILAILEISILILLFHPTIFIQTQLNIYILVLFTIVIGAIISFFFSFLISLIAFWSNEVWAPRFIFIVFLNILTGTLFPLDVLPHNLYNLLLFTPFPYLIYLPTKIYLHGFSSQLIFPIMFSIIWAFILYSLAKFIWRKGMESYSFYGK